MASYFNVSGDKTQELVEVGSSTKTSKILVANTHVKSSCKVDLYIEKQGTGKFYLIKNVIIPVGATIVYDDLSFSNKVGEFGLYIKLTKTDTFTLTGSIDPTGTNTDVPGTNTLFLSELSIGDEIVVSGETRTISTITNNTTASVTAAWGSDLSNDTSPDCNPTALVDVIIS